MSIRTEAADALAAREAAEQEAQDTARSEQRTAAVAAFRVVLATGDGTPAVPLNSLTVEVNDLEARLVIVTDPASDPPVSLAAQDRDGDGVYRVHLVAKVDGEWTRLSGVLADLAELGEALEEVTP